MLSCFVVSYTQRPSGFKAIIKSIFKTNLRTFVNVGSLLLADSFALSFLKFTKSCKNASNNEIYLQEIYQSSNQETVLAILINIRRQKIAADISKFGGSSGAIFCHYKFTL
jgi:hypothetical protein